MALRTASARDFQALVRKLYARHGISHSAMEGSTIAMRHAVQRQYVIRRKGDRYVATPRAASS